MEGRVRWLSVGHCTADVHPLDAKPQLLRVRGDIGGGSSKTTQQTVHGGRFETRSVHCYSGGGEGTCGTCLAADKMAVASRASIPVGR